MAGAGGCDQELAGPETFSSGELWLPEEQDSLPARLWASGGEREREVQLSYLEMTIAAICTRGGVSLVRS